MASSGISQATRLGKFHSPLGAERLLLKRFTGNEWVNELFDFRLDVADNDGDIDYDQLLGKPGTVEIERYDGSSRYFHGIITEASYLGHEEVSHTYNLRLRPWLWLLSLAENNRIFHEKSVEDILDEVFGAYGQSKVEKRLTKSHPKIHYTVQFNETDLNFVFRMMERHGINYFFTFANGSHTLVLSDENSGFKKSPDGSVELNFSRHHSRAEHLWSWSDERQVTTGKVRLTDYNFETPNAGMQGSGSGSLSHGESNLETYGFPGLHKDSGEGAKVAQLRADQKRSQDFRHRAQGDVVQMTCGERMTLGGEAPSKSRDKEYICVRATHTFINSDYGSTDGAEASYAGDYGFADYDKPFAPEMKTKIRAIEGPQTAKVVGSGEIDCDKYGRILVKFHWDDKNAHSMRVRCAQMWAHNKWGSMFIPRIGMEVVVIFIDGDPERPLVVGCVYNGANDPPYALPGKKNIAGIKSRSTTGGGTDNYNELYFDDTKGSELFNQQAEKDMETLVKNDERRFIKQDRTTEIDRDETRTVKRDEAHTIKRHSTWTVDMNETRLVKMKRKAEVKMDETLKVGMNRKSDVKMNDEYKSGLQTKMKAGVLFEIKVGSSKITLTPASIEIKSTMITVNGSAMTIIKGGMVMIN